jgi:cytidyltransferase-like protein
VTSKTDTVVVSGGFDDIRSQDVRFLQEAVRFGLLHVFLWDDELLRSATEKQPKFPEQERLYYMQAICFVHKVHLVHNLSDTDTLPNVPDVKPTVWAVTEYEHTPQKQAYCQTNNLRYEIVKQQQLQGFPNCDTNEPNTPPAFLQKQEGGRKKVLVTGSFDWFHSGHVRFFEECSELGELYVVVGHDANIKTLKGPGHPKFGEQERRYMVQSVRYVKQALISTGNGWLDAEPEIERIKPDIYAVNEDGDKPIKRRYCQEHGIEYIVLNRLPKPGLQRRESTKLRGF